MINNMMFHKFDKLLVSIIFHDIKNIQSDRGTSSYSHDLEPNTTGFSLRKQPFKNKIERKIVTLFDATKTPYKVLLIFSHMSFDMISLC
jgi:hypothetical protein